jgi:hypothetical protein
MEFGNRTDRERYGSNHPEKHIKIKKTYILTKQAQNVPETPTVKKTVHVYFHVRS